eukprot:CAMPEP_0119119316 /NCGR_PEP_ID=MMETSP1310-20130426/857_1 /TAXON_ID=464262 /ORGANISM="Genus nov. species nov., Strain RCC2339" /LENGTH=538 /DNA_ID=CAMNT_0007108741 /DNA_START=42 /DNA_END=1658 /DNA_ORIENTATION=+
MKEVYKKRSVPEAHIIAGILGCLVVGLVQGRTWNFAEDTSSVLYNPERGFYAYRGHDDLWGLDGLVTGDANTPPRSLVFARILAENFRAADFSTAFLTEISGMFDSLRAAGLKVIPRVTYNSGPDGTPACDPYGCDAPLAQVLRHIEQMGPIWRANMDIIALVDPGFIGGWGEWHSSTNGLDTVANKRAILNAILEEVPTDRMVYLRYPPDKRTIFGSGSPAMTAGVTVDSSEAFDGSAVARVGHLNDCLLSSASDVGTYQGEGGFTRAEEEAHIASETPFVPYGGETCADYELSDCASAISNFELLRINHLNHDYHPDVIAKWKTFGCHTEIAQRLGYRFVANSVTYPETVAAGETTEVSCTLENKGFGELYNDRDVEVVLLDGTTDAVVLAVTVNVDPRLWQAGGTYTFSQEVSVPPGMPLGPYSVGVRLADKEAGLRSNAAYSVRFANSGANGYLYLDGINVFGRARMEVVPAIVPSPSPSPQPSPTPSPTQLTPAIPPTPAVQPVPTSPVPPPSSGSTLQTSFLFLALLIISLL